MTPEELRLWARRGEHDADGMEGQPTPAAPTASRWDETPTDYAPVAPAPRPAAVTLPATPPQRRAGRGRLLIAAAVVLAAVGATVAVVLSERATAPASFHLPGRATGLAVGGGRVWVAAPATGAVWILDAGSGRSAGPPLRTGGTPARLALAAGGAWVADTEHATVLRLPRPAAPVPAGPDVADLAFAAGTLWVASAADGTVRALPARGASVLPVGRRPLALAADARRVVVVGAAGTLVRIDARTRRTTGPPIRVGGVLVAVTLIGDSAWVADASSGTVRRIDLVAGRPAGAAVHVGGAPVALAADGGDLYVLCRAAGTLVRIDPASGRIRSRLPVGPDPTALALDRAHVWVAAARRLLRVDR